MMPYLPNSNNDTHTPCIHVTADIKRTQGIPCWSKCWFGEKQQENTAETTGPLTLKPDAVNEGSTFKQNLRCETGNNPFDHRFDRRARNAVRQ